MQKDREYTENSGYWDRKDSLVMGDIRQRPELLKLLGNIQGLSVLESGCGTGFFTRKIASLGAEVYGCDIEESMLLIAQDTETNNPVGIKYSKQDIRHTNYPDNFFDCVVSVGVLFHLNRQGWLEYLKDSYRLLKSGGKLYISIEHPFLFTKTSPTRTESVCWAKHTPVGEVANYKESQLFKEEYFKSNGDTFVSTLWHHPLEFIVNAIIQNNFQILEIKEIEIAQEDLQSEFWGEQYGYPGFIQFVLGK